MIKQLLFATALFGAACTGASSDDPVTQRHALIATAESQTTALLPADKIDAFYAAPWVQGVLSKHMPDGSWVNHLVHVYSSYQEIALDRTPGRVYDDVDFDVTPESPYAITMMSCHSPGLDYDVSFDFDTCETLAGPRKVWFEASDVLGYIRLRYEGTLANGDQIAGTFLTEIAPTGGEWDPDAPK